MPRPWHAHCSASLFGTVAELQAHVDLRAEIDRLALQCAESRASYQRLLASARLVMAEAEDKLARSFEKPEQLHQRELVSDDAVDPGRRGRRG